MPTPRPEILVTSIAVENPRSEDKTIDLGLGFCRHLGFADEAEFNGPAFDECYVEAAAIVCDFNQDVTALPART
jgi:hypothetical protein